MSIISDLHLAYVQVRFPLSLPLTLFTFRLLKRTLL